MRSILASARWLRPRLRRFLRNVAPIVNAALEFVSQECNDPWIEPDRGLGPTGFPIADRLWVDAELRELCARESPVNSLPTDVVPECYRVVRITGWLSWGSLDFGLQSQKGSPASWARSQSPAEGIQGLQSGTQRTPKLLYRDPARHIDTPFAVPNSPFMDTGEHSERPLGKAKAMPSGSNSPRKAIRIRDEARS